MPQEPATPDFDALVEMSRQGENKLGEQALWRAAVGVAEWYFVARGTGDDAEPLIGGMGGKPYILAFTDEEQAAMFAKRRAMQQSDARGSARDAASMEGATLTMDVPDALAYCADLAKAGVEGILFNSGPNAFQCSLIELADRAGRYREDR